MTAGQSLPLVLLAGGLATRMKPETEKLPKSLLPVAGRPFIAHQLALAVKNGVSEVVVCVGHLGEMIEGYVGDGAAFGINARYSCDGEKPLGTGGATLKASQLINGPFFVMYGDSYLTVDYRAVADAYVGSGKRGLMTVYKNCGLWDDSNAVFADGRVSVYSKRRKVPGMDYIDYGLCVLSGDALDGWKPGGAFDLADVYERLAQSGELAGYEARERFFEIGSPAGLAELDALLSQRAGGAEPPRSKR